MKQHSKSLLIPSACCVAWLAFAAGGCDAGERPDDELRSEANDAADPDDADLAAEPLADVWAHELLMRSVDGGPLEPMGGSCSLLDPDEVEGGSGGGGGPDIGFYMETADGEASYQYYVAPEGTAPQSITKENGELAAQIDVDVETLLEDEVVSVSFVSHDGVQYEAFVWGDTDCDDGPNLEPPV